MNHICMKQYLFEAKDFNEAIYGKPTSSVHVPVSVLVKRLVNPFRKVLLEILAVFVKNISIPKYWH